MATLSQNAPTQRAKESSSDQSRRLVDLAKSELDKIADEATKDPKFFGRPSIELVIQNGSVAAVNVNRNQSIK